MAKAILLSGGIDSIALAYWKKPEVAITIDYGQLPAKSELRVSETVCQILGIEHHVISVDCSKLGSGDLVANNPLSFAPSTEWWPYRNQLLVTLAGMKATIIGVNEIMIASVCPDGFHKDGTSEFYKLINSLMNYQEGGLIVSAPAISLSSEDLVLTSQIPSKILLYAHSCHKNNVPCGHCRGCYKYINVIKKLDDAEWKKP